MIANINPYSFDKKSYFSCKSYTTTSTLDIIKYLFNRTLHTANIKDSLCICTHKDLSGKISLEISQDNRNSIWSREKGEHRRFIILYCKQKYHLPFDLPPFAFLKWHPWKRFVSCEISASHSLEFYHRNVGIIGILKTTLTEIKKKSSALYNLTWASIKLLK